MTVVEAGSPLHGRCDCRDVAVTVTRPPERIDEGRCGQCRRIGARRACLGSGEVRIEGATVACRRADRTPRFRRCGQRGIVTHRQRHGRPDGAVLGVGTATLTPDALHGIPVVAGAGF